MPSYSVHREVCLSRLHRGCVWTQPVLQKTNSYRRSLKSKARSASLSSEGGTQASQAISEPQLSAVDAAKNQSNTSRPTSDSASHSSSTADSSIVNILLQTNPSQCRKALACESGMEAIEILQGLKPDLKLQSEDLEVLLQAALERGNIKLALSIHDSMLQARRSSTSMRGTRASVDASFKWPAAKLSTTCCLVLGLSKQLAIDQALRVLSEIKVQGLPRNDAVGFGKVISSPLAPNQTLTVVQPQEGLKLVADAFSRYEYEVFSGTVLNVKSEALQLNTSLLLAALRAVGLLRKPPPAAIHEFTVQAPDGVSRTFRVATPSADVPAQTGERVTFVCSPSPATARNPNKKRQQGLLSSSPPDTTPGEALTATNHVTGVVTQLLPPPLSSSQTGIPGWVLPVAVLAAGGDAASSLIDPTLPLLIAASAAGVAGSAVAGQQVLIPKLKQLPEKAVSLEYVRQRLLGQYSQLASKAETVMAEGAEDIRMLARLVQLQNKMQSLGANASASYAARMERVSSACTSIEQRLAKKIELLDGYGRVMNMIEIEVEMELQVPAAELEGIEQQMVRITELESLQDEWRLQAEARDEVERLLRTA